MIRGVVEHGAVRLLDAVPSEWPEGQEIRIEPVLAKTTETKPLIKRGRSAAEVHARLNIQGPVPDDATVKQWIDEHRMEKYGR